MSDGNGHADGQLVALLLPRWIGGPPICPKENLPAFTTKDELMKYRDDNCPRMPIEHVGKCTACGYWHAR